MLQIFEALLISNACPICKESKEPPTPIKHSFLRGYKYRCEKCKAEYWLKITKEAEPKKDKEIQNIDETLKTLTEPTNILRFIEKAIDGKYPIPQ